MVTEQRLPSYFTTNVGDDLRIFANMASPSVPRLLTNTIRHVCRARPRLYTETFKRAASTKHPIGFSPPSTDELTELRDRVQEFTSESSMMGPGNTG